MDNAGQTAICTIINSYEKSGGTLPFSFVQSLKVFKDLSVAKQFKKVKQKFGWRVYTCSERSNVPAVALGNS